MHVTGSLNLAENIWITDGSEATVPGTHVLSAGVKFDYGLGQSGGWYMTGKADGYNGQILTAAQVRKDFAGDQIWAWAVIDDSGTTSYGYVTSVNGHQADPILGLEAQGGKVTAYVLPFSARIRLLTGSRAREPRAAEGEPSPGSRSGTSGDTALGASSCRARACQDRSEPSPMTTHYEATA